MIEKGECHVRMKMELYLKKTMTGSAHEGSQTLSCQLLVTDSIFYDRKKHGKNNVRRAKVNQTHCLGGPEVHLSEAANLAQRL